MLRYGFHAKDGQRIDSSGAAIAHHADYYGSAGSSTLILYSLLRTELLRGS